MQQAELTHRIAAGALIEQEGRILLLRHCRTDALEAHDFWVAPGGGVMGGENLAACAVRETFEECGLLIAVEQLAYVEEFANAKLRACKFWFTAQIIGGEVTQVHRQAEDTHILGAQWFTQAELAGKTIYPPMLQDDYWQRRQQQEGFAQPVFMCLA